MTATRSVAATIPTMNHDGPSRPVSEKEQNRTYRCEMDVTNLSTELESGRQNESSLNDVVQKRKQLLRSHRNMVVDVLNARRQMNLQWRSPLRVPLDSSLELRNDPQPERTCDIRECRCSGADQANTAEPFPPSLPTEWSTITHCG